LASLAPVRRPGRPSPLRRRPGQLTRPGGITRTIAFLAFTGFLAANVALNAFKIGGVPIRGVVAAGVLAFLAILYSDVAKLALKRNLLLLGFAGGLAVL